MSFWEGWRHIFSLHKELAAGFVLEHMVCMQERSIFGLLERLVIPNNDRNPIPKILLLILCFFLTINWSPNGCENISPLLATIWKHRKLFHLVATILIHSFLDVPDAAAGPQSRSLHFVTTLV